MEKLTYRITAGAGGVHGPKYVHLYNVPGGRFDFGGYQDKSRTGVVLVL